MTGSIVYNPFFDWPILWGACAAIAIVVLIAWWRGLSGWWLRLLAGAMIVLALTRPEYQAEDRKPLNDIVIIVVDRSSSQTLSDRKEQTDQALEDLQTRLIARGNVDVRLVEVPDGADNTGTMVATAIQYTLREEPSARVAGVFVISDGQIHDADIPLNLPAPLHLLRTGYSTDWDRRLNVRTAPAFGIVDEPVTLSLRVDDLGLAPADAAYTTIDISVDGGDPQRYQMPIGKDIDLPVRLSHTGRNVIQFTIPTEAGELTDRNNTAIIQINGVRDRLRVLLVSGEPHPGGRTWRNLLKSDSSVDLVHFTILRPPEKQDGVPVSELSLIAFPTRELFMEKIDDFDLIIFDRYQRRGILPASYFENIARYVREGGAILFAAGPDFAGVNSLYRSPLSDVIPAAPSSRLFETPFRPAISELGAKHPVTSGLIEQQEIWGQWLRQIDVTPTAGQVVMTGVQGRPLLILNRVEKGRVALLASDQAWLWGRGYDGGGPQLELLRRLAHWMMGEPDLEEEALWAEESNQQVRIIRQSMGDVDSAAKVTAPSGETFDVELIPDGPGRFVGKFIGAELGLYRIDAGDKSTVIGLGPAAPLEFENPVATDDVIKPLIEPLRGGIISVEDGTPLIRDVRLGRVATGRGWLGITPRGVYETLRIVQVPFLPAWLALLIAASLILFAWLREGRN